MDKHPIQEWQVGGGGGGVEIPLVALYCFSHRLVITVATCIFFYFSTDQTAQQFLVG